MFASTLISCVLYSLAICAPLIAFTSCFEWVLHRFFMHHPFGGIFKYPYERHALIHHRIFKADETYHLKNEKDRSTIPMAWWNGPVLVLIGTILTLPFSFLFHTWLITWDGLLIFGGYYGAYEYLHWCMHLPRQRRLEHSWIFRRLNGHHLLHHRYMKKNFNVVLPFADIIFFTLRLRSKTHFLQATGPSVPDVQPKETKPGEMRQKPLPPFFELP